MGNVYVWVAYIRSDSGKGLIFVFTSDAIMHTALWNRTCAAILDYDGS